MIQPISGNRDASYWQRFSQQLEGALLQWGGFGEVLESDTVGIGLDAAAVAAQGGQFSQQGLEAVNGIALGADPLDLFSLR